MTYNEMMIDDLLRKIEIQNQKIGDMDKEIERLHKVFTVVIVVKNTVFIPTQTV